MSLLRRMVYMGIGGLLVLAVVVVGAAALAQEDAPSGDGEQSGDEEGSVTTEQRAWGFHGVWDDDYEEMLAEALGISEEELEAAHEEARTAAIDQALEEGLITEEQAEQLREGGRAFRFGRRLHRAFGSPVDTDELLAEALGITVEELQEARSEVRAAQLEALVETGVLTQEQADLIAAREAVAGFVDREALAAVIQDAYETAIQAALDAGAITQEQADQLLENLPVFESFGFGAGGPVFHSHGFGPEAGGAFALGISVPSFDASFDV